MTGQFSNDADSGFSQRPTQSAGRLSPYADLAYSHSVDRALFSQPDEATLHKGFFNTTRQRDYVSPSGSRLQFALMAVYARIIQSLGSFAMIAALSGQATAQESARSTDRSSCQKFAQEFYGWYVPLTQMAHRARSDEKTKLLLIDKKEPEARASSHNG
jgi:hypothetical protein